MICMRLSLLVLFLTSASSHRGAPRRAPVRKGDRSSPVSPIHHEASPDPERSGAESGRWPDASSSSSGGSIVDVLGRSPSAGAASPAGDDALPRPTARRRAKPQRPAGDNAAAWWQRFMELACFRQARACLRAGGLVRLPRGAFSRFHAHVPLPLATHKPADRKPLLRRRCGKGVGGLRHRRGPRRPGRVLCKVERAHTGTVIGAAALGRGRSTGTAS